MKIVRYYLLSRYFSTRCLKARFWQIILHFSGLLSGVLGRCFFKRCYDLFGELMDALALLNGAINFVLYCSMSRQFRTTFGQMMRTRCASATRAGSHTELQTTYVWSYKKKLVWHLYTGHRHSNTCKTVLWNMMPLLLQNMLQTFYSIGSIKGEIWSGFSRSSPNIDIKYNHKCIKYFLEKLFKDHRIATKEKLW